jgi:hypothetical protein
VKKSVFSRKALIKLIAAGFLFMAVAVPTVSHADAQAPACFEGCSEEMDAWMQCLYGYLNRAQYGYVNDCHTEMQMFFVCDEVRQMLCK